MPMLTLYRLTTIALTPLARPLLSLRARAGKEHPERLLERMGVAGSPRPDGRLVWLHGASIGESLALLPLVERLIQRGVETLVTSGTASSASVLAARLPAGATHQFLPLDAPKFVARFLDHWRPDLVLFAESEIWPNMICAARARGLPLILVNARISRRSAARWRRLPGAGARLFRTIDLCLAQDVDNAARFIGLGVSRVRVAGNLKFDVAAPPADAARLAGFRGAVGARPMWAAASTHSGEEETVLDAHVELARLIPSLLTVIVPRHPERGPDIAALARSKGLPPALRSSGAEPHGGVDIYIADTIGELGLVFRVAGLVFMGRSLTADGGGHNPIEPAKLGCAILHGPHVGDFAEVYAELDAAGAAASVADVEQLAGALHRLLSEPSRKREMGRAGAQIVERLGGASRNIMAAIEPCLAPCALDQT